MKPATPVAHSPRFDGEDASAAIDRQLEATQARSAIDDTPAWFFPAMQTVMQTILHPTLSTLTLMHNEKLGDGSQWPFQVVNFHDGTNPTAPPHNLPLLSNCAVVDNLSDPQCTLYFLGYYPGEPVPNQIATRKKKILAAIGHWRI